GHRRAGRATRAVAVGVVAGVVDVAPVLGEAGALHLDAVGRAQERLLVLPVPGQSRRRYLRRSVVLGVGLEREGVVGQEEVAEVATLLVGRRGGLGLGGGTGHGGKGPGSWLGAEVGRVFVLGLLGVLVPVRLVIVIVRLHGCSLWHPHTNAERRNCPTVAHICSPFVSLVTDATLTHCVIALAASESRSA